MTGTWLDGNVVRIDDVNTWPASIPARRVHELRDLAKASDSGRVRFGLRWFDRDALIGAADLLDARPQCDGCHDAPGVHDMGDGLTYCPACCSRAQGSRYDDKESFDD